MVVVLTAPKEVSDLARRCHSEFVRIGRMLTDGDADAAAILAETTGAAQASGMLMVAMRADLGLGGDEQSVAGPVSGPAG
jgi:hypothetical protein